MNESKITKENIRELRKIRNSFDLSILKGGDIFPQKGITYWEEINCVGYNPELSRLEAIVSIKLASGYSGNLCTGGSFEYVRFFIDWGKGNGFEDLGHTSFKAFDISNAPSGPQHPLNYMVYWDFDVEAKKECCDTPVLPKVRAVLSWKKVPSLDPDEMPVFGNRMDVDIQIKPKETTLKCILSRFQIDEKLNIFKSVDLEKGLKRVKPFTQIPGELRIDWKKADIPAHRLFYPVVYPVIKTGKSITTFPWSDIGKFDIDFAQIIDELQSKKSNTNYEEVVCVGLNSATDQIGAVVQIKQPTGYSGDLCDDGSIEYVAFWADWNNDGAFDEYLGTAEVEVHSIDSIPDKGLFYCVNLPCNFQQHLENCKNPNVIRIRAVLSWQTKPSETDPDDLNYWGNLLDVVVQIRPGISGDQIYHLFYDIGNVPVEDISLSTHLAHPSTGLLVSANCRQPALDRPFAGVVRIGGRLYNTGVPGSVYYQVQYSPHGLGKWLPVTHYHQYELMHPDPTDLFYPKETVVEHSPDGWFPYLEDFTGALPILERTSCLARWNTGSMEGEYDLRIAFTRDYPILPSSVIYYSEIHTIVLDNTNFIVNPFAADAIDYDYTLDLVIDGGDCHSYEKGYTIDGHLRALDQHFWMWDLELQPATHTHSTKANPHCRSYGSLTEQGDTNAEWHLDTSDLDPCGYTLTLRAWDRAIVNSNGAVHHWNRKAVGFSVHE